jgi:uncharacterized Zn-binding protein involved in type VI secretion
VRTGWDCSTINGQAMAREGDEVDCPKCDSIGRIVCDGPRLVDLLEERNAALDGDLCKCKCDPPPRLIANQTLSCQEIEGGFAPRARATAQPAAAPPPNTTLFLDVFPLHAFYKERGLLSLETCLPSRSDIYGHGQHPVLWPVAQETLKFGTDYKQILQAFKAIEAGNIADSVVHLAWHEQQNILQPAMYNDWRLVWLLRSNHASYITGIPFGAAEAIELTLTSQCRPSADGRSIGFGRNPIADLSDVQQRMAFVLKAAAQFDELLRRSDRQLIEQAILDISAGRGVR